MARGPFIKWEQVIRDLVALLGVNTPQATRREQIADAVGVKVAALDKLLRQLRAIGALEIQAVAGPMRPAKTVGGKPTPVRTQQYMITKSADDILFIGKKRDIKWGQDVPHQPLPGGRTQIAQVPASRLDGPVLIDVAVVTKPPVSSWKAERVTEATPHVEVETPTVAAVGDERNDNPFAALKPLKRNDAMALIEAARQYESRMAFVLEEVERFRAHGLTLDPAMVGLPRDERLEGIFPILDYVSTIERQNERLQVYAGQADTDKELHLRITRQQEEINRLTRDRANQINEVTRTANQWSGKRATLEQRIAALEQENRDLRNKLHPPQPVNGVGAAAVK